MRISKEWFDYFMQPEISSRMTFQNTGILHERDWRSMELTPADFRIAGNTIQSDITDGESLNIGGSYSKTITVVLDNRGRRFDEKRLVDGSIDLYVRYTYPIPPVISPIYDPEDTGEKELFFGRFEIVDVSYGDYTISLEGVDYMSRFEERCDLPLPPIPIEIEGEENVELEIENDEPFPPVSIYCTLGELVQKICDRCWMNNYVTEFTNSDLCISWSFADYLYKYNCRQALEFIAQIGGCNAVLSTDDPTGEHTSWGLKFVPIHKAPPDIPPLVPTPGVQSECYDFTSVKNVKMGSALDSYHITGIIINGTTVVNSSYSSRSDEEQTILIGTDRYPFIIENNPLIFFPEEGQLLPQNNLTTATKIARGLAEALEITDENGNVNEEPGVFVTPCSFSCPQNPFVEPGDWILIRRLQEENPHKALVTNVTYTTGGYTQIECRAETPANKKIEVSNFSAKQITEINQMSNKYYNERIEISLDDIAVGSDLPTGNLFLVYED